MVSDYKTSFGCIIYPKVPLRPATLLKRDFNAGASL